MSALRTSQAPPLAGTDSSPMESTAQPSGVAPDDDGMDLPPTGAALPSTEPITSFLLQVRQQAADGAVDLTPGAAPPADVSQLPPPANSAADGGAVAASPVAATTRKRKVRGKSNSVARDERKRQRRAAFLLTLQDNAGADT